MEIKLSPEIEAVVARDMASGRYGSVEEYIAEAVDALHEREEWVGESLEEQGEELDASLREAELGEGMSLEEVREGMQAMKVRWMAERAQG